MSINVKKEKLNITPDKSIYPKLGQTGYSAAEALSELVDNSIDARIKNESLVIRIDVNKNSIVIEDDGLGMDKDTASKSLILGYSRKNNQLGEFGLGLKTACTSLGEMFIVETSKKSSDVLCKIEFDEDKFVNSGSWEDFDMEVHEGVNINKSGTKIAITKLRINIHPNTVTNIKKQLVERFAPLIVNKDVKVYVNGTLLKAQKPKIIPNSKENIRIRLSNGSNVLGWVGILEKGSQKGSGFNMFRRDRLIRSNEKLGYKYHPSKMWITGELNLDNIPVTHNKREFIIEDALYVEFLKKFQEILDPFLKKAQQKHRENKIKDLRPEERETLKDNILKSIENIDDFKDLAFSGGSKPEKRSENEGELFEKEVRERKVTGVREKTKKEIEADKKKKRTPRKTQSKKVRFITISGKKFKFDYEWGELEENNIPKIAELDKKKGLIFIILNSSFPTVNVLKDQVFYTALYVCEGIAEVFLSENNLGVNKIIPLRDKMMQELSQIMTEDSVLLSHKEEMKISQTQAKILDKKNEKKIEKVLTKKERNVVNMRFKQNMTLQKIGDEEGITRERVRQIEKMAINKIAAF